MRQDRFSRSRSRWSLWLVVLGCLAGGFLAGVLARPAAEAEETARDPYARLDTFAQVIAQIERSYVETVDQDELVYGAIKGMVRALDPHSTFLTPKELEALRNRTQGQFVGVGIEVGVRDGKITIIAPIAGGPAEAAGVEAGDVIIFVDGKSARDWSLTDAIERLRGDEGTTVEITVRREGVQEPLKFELERQVVKVASVEHYMLEPGYGYVSVRTFARNIGHDVRKAYDELVALNGGEKLDGLVLDLRSNPGGLLSEAVDLSNVFLENGLIVSTQGRDGFELARHDADARRAYIDAPLAVLVNGGSASASEIVAGALQDHERAIVVGTQTFGKGSVQNIYDLDDGSGLKLTIARYYTPDHRSIQGLGIAPDIVAPDVPVPAAPERRRVREADLEGSLTGDDDDASDGSDSDDEESDPPKESAPPGADSDSSRDGADAGATDDAPSDDTAASDATDDDADDDADPAGELLRQLPVRTAVDQLRGFRILSGME